MCVTLISTAGTVYANSFTDNGNGTVTDNTTGLMWEQKTGVVGGPQNYNDPHNTNNLYSWYDPATSGGFPGYPSGDGTDTQSFITSLNSGRFAGYSDWRMPSICELASLVNSSYYPPMDINTAYFPNIQPDSAYWSSTSNLQPDGLAWIISFDNGFIDCNCLMYFVTEGSALAVRGKQSGPLGNSIVTVSPSSQNEKASSGSSTFYVYPAVDYGNGSIPWTAVVTSGRDWLSITSGSSGTQAGFITYSFTANTDAAPRTATIEVTTCSPTTVTVTQEGAFSCTATVDGSQYLLHIPYISYTNPVSETLWLWADLLCVYSPSYPQMLIFKLTNNNLINNPSLSCTAATLSMSGSDLGIHIPDVLLPGWVTHIWADLTYNAALSTDGNDYFVVTNFGYL